MTTDVDPGYGAPVTDDTWATVLETLHELDHSAWIHEIATRAGLRQVQVARALRLLQSQGAVGRANDRWALTEDGHTLVEAGT